MDSILNNKMKECYNISNKVVSKYDELFDIMIEHSLEDSSIYEPYVSDILELVLEEYKVYSTLTLMDINMYLQTIEKSKCDDSMVGFRFKSKLESSKSAYTGIKINKTVLNLDMIPENLKFNLYKSFISSIDIEMMKRIKYKLDSLSTDNYDDLNFVNYLYREFNITLLYQAIDNNLTEILYLMNNMDVNKVPNIDIRNLINLIDEILELSNDMYFNPSDITLISFAKIAVDRLVNDEFENNPRAIFSFFAFVTRLEILTDYMNKDELMNLLNYCNMINVSNNFGIEEAIKLIKKKIG